MQGVSGISPHPAGSCWARFPHNHQKHDPPLSPGRGPAHLHAPVRRCEAGGVVRPYVRATDLPNMVAGGFKNDLVALNDTTPHDQRYDRLIEYTRIIRDLLASSLPVSHEGAYYTVKNLKLTPPLAPELFPGIFVSGSSDAGLAAAQAIGAVAVKYPKAPEEEVAPNEGVGAGVRVGIIAREDGDEAWRVARERFPEYRRGQLTHQLAMKVSDSVWHGQLSDLADATAAGDSPYWLRRLPD